MGYEFIAFNDPRHRPVPKTGNASYYLKRGAEPDQAGVYDNKEILFRTNGTVPFNQDWDLLHIVIEYIHHSGVLDAIGSYRKITLRNKIQNAMWDGHRFYAYLAVLEVIDRFNELQAARAKQLREEIDNLT